MSNGTGVIAIAVIFIPCQTAVPSTWVGTGVIPLSPAAAASLLAAAPPAAFGVAAMLIPLIPLIPLMLLLMAAGLAPDLAAELPLAHPATTMAIRASGAARRSAPRSRANVVMGFLWGR